MRRVLVGVSGGIAAYKAAELVRALVRGGTIDVRVAMTRAAREFVTPLTLQALSGNPVATELFDLAEEAEAPPGANGIGHIALADWAELAVVAPATADVLARLAMGAADDILTTVLLASKAPLVVAPAMNVNMWQHPATQANLATLRARGVHVVGPDAGDLACGWVGAGRMAEPPEIAAVVERLLGGGDLNGVAVMVTAGPTYEPLDPVRFLGNRSSGKMGFAVAAAAARRGATVTLVAGPTALVTPPGVRRVDVETAAQMRAAVLAEAGAQAVVVMAAAVADYRPATAANTKLKKEALGDSPSLALTKNADILAELSSLSSPRPLLVGFAAETDDVERRAADKRRVKNCELLVANDVSAAGSGFGTDTNRVLLVDAGGSEWLPQMSKGEVAERIWDRVVKLRSKP